MIGFIIGLFVGCFLGVLAMALFAISGRADDRIEQMIKEKDE